MHLSAGTCCVSGEAPEREVAETGKCFVGWDGEDSTGWGFGFLGRWIEDQVKQGSLVPGRGEDAGFWVGEAEPPSSWGVLQRGTRPRGK